MALETGSFISDLTPTNPLASDPAGQGDDHIRLIKTVLQNNFPNMASVLGQTRSIAAPQTIDASYNTSLIVTGAAVALTLPPSASITAGWYVDLQTNAGGTITLTPQAGQSINGGSTFTLPPNTAGRLAFQSANAFWASASPSGAGVAVFSNGMHVDGNLSVSGSFYTSGLAQFGAGVSISGALAVTGAAQLNGAVSISGALDVNGALVSDGTAQFNGATFSVSGVATFKGAMSISGAAVVAGTNTLDSTGLHIVRAAAGPTLEMSGPAGTHRQILMETAGVNRWRISADSLAEGGSDAGSALVFASYTDAGAFKSAVLSLSRADSSAVFSGAVTVGGAASISGATVLQSTLSVLGAASISGLATLNNVAINGNITTPVTISGQTVLQSGLTVNGAATISGLATFTTDVAINGNITTGVTISGQTVLNGLTVRGAATISGALTLSSGQIVFPASQNASANVNTLDDYEEGTWTPSITFNTPGDLAVTYSVRLGTYTKIGDTVNVWCRVFTSAFTFTTASGNLRLTGLPFAATGNASMIQALALGPLTGIGFPATYTQTCAALYQSSPTEILFTATDWQTARSSLNLVQTNATSGSQKDICVGGTYKAS